MKQERVSLRIGAILIGFAISPQKNRGELMYSYTSTKEGIDHLQEAIDIELKRILSTTTTNS